MRDTQHQFVSEGLISAAIIPRMTYYEVCLTCDDLALAGQHTGEMADLSEAFATIFERSRSLKERVFADPLGGGLAKAPFDGALQ